MCNHTCSKECNNTICNAKHCNMACEANSNCRAVKCGQNVENCNLDCKKGATCKLNCTTGSNCKHSCALSGQCYTWVGEHLDVHYGQCGKCNCTSNIRNCIQRCESAGGRCLHLYCDASNRCEQYSKSTGQGFVYMMRSTSPNGMQVGILLLLLLLLLFLLCALSFSLLKRL